METRANYFRIGVFTILVLGVVVAFFYWLLRSESNVATIPVEIVFEGNVGGLSSGSSVFYNGLPAGEVVSLRHDPENPAIVVASVRLYEHLRIRQNVRISIGSQGLTGITFINLSGGGVDQPVLMSTTEIPRLRAHAASTGDLVQIAQRVAGRVETLLSSAQKIIDNSEQSIATSLQNVEVFTGSLAENSEKIESTISAIDTGAASIRTITTRLIPVIEKADAIISSIDPDDVRRISTNAAGLSERLVALADQGSHTIATADALLASGSAQIEAIGNNTNAMVMELRADIDIASTRLANAFDGVDELIAESRSIVEALEETIGKSNALIGAVSVTDVETASKNIAKTADNLEKFSNKLNRTLQNFDRSVVDINSVTDLIVKRSQDIDTTIANAAVFSNEANEVARKVSDLLTNLDEIISSEDGVGLLQNASETLTLIRNTASVVGDDLEVISGNLRRFSNSGTKNADGVLRELQSVLRRFNRVLIKLERDPSAFLLGGGTDVPKYRR